MNNKYELIEEFFTIDDSKKILDYYNGCNDLRKKKWMEEIFPFKNYLPWNKIKEVLWFYINYIQILLWFNSDKSLFIYKNSRMFFSLKPKDKWLIYLSLVLKWEKVAFITLKKRQLRNKIIFIDKLISIKKWWWTQSIMSLKNKYNINNFKLEYSWNAKYFWEKIKSKFKWEINITINPVK